MYGMWKCTSEHSPLPRRETSTSYRVLNGKWPCKINSFTLYPIISGANVTAMSCDCPAAMHPVVGCTSKGQVVLLLELLIILLLLSFYIVADIILFYEPTACWSLILLVKSSTRITLFIFFDCCVSFTIIEFTLGVLAS